MLVLGWHPQQRPVLFSGILDRGKWRVSSERGFWVRPSPRQACACFSFLVASASLSLRPHALHSGPELEVKLGTAGRALRLLLSQSTGPRWAHEPCSGWVHIEHAGTERRY